MSKNIFSDILNDYASKSVKRDKTSVISENEKNGYATLTIQKNKNSKSGFSVYLYNAKLASENIVKALHLNAKSVKPSINYNLYNDFKNAIENALKSDKTYTSFSEFMKSQKIAVIEKNDENDENDENENA